MTKNKTDISWSVPEYSEHKRSKRWYMIAITILSLLLIYSFLTANFLFAIILIIVGITMTIQDRQKTPEVIFSISDDGITLGEKLYSFSTFKNFWMYYDPEENKMLFLEFKNSIKPRLAVPLLNKNPLRVRSILLRYLTEDIEKENEPVSEQLTRLLKL